MTRIPDDRARQVLTRPGSGRSQRLATVLGLCAGLLGAAPDAVAQLTPTHRITTRFNVGWRPASRTFADARAFTANLEQGRFQAAYELKDGAVIDGGASFRIWRNLGVGLDVSDFRKSHQALLASELPHPFFFDRPRTTTGRAVGLEREELGIHLRALWVSQFADWLVVSVSAGPSLISATQHVVSSVQHTEVGFPFNEVIFTGHTSSSQTKIARGLNGGLDIDSFFLHRLPFLRNFAMLEHVGVGLLARYVRGMVMLEVDGQPLEVDVGGLQITSGVRLRF